MYSKVVVFVYTVGFVYAGNILQAASPVPYSVQPAVSHVSITTHGSLANPMTSYFSRPTLATYSAPSSSYRSVPAINSYAAIPRQVSSITPYSSAPAVSYQSISTSSAPLKYAAPPVVAGTYSNTPYSTFAAPAISGYRSTPVVGKAISPEVSYSSVSSNSAPLATYTAASPYSTYTTVPALKTAPAYSVAPIVSHASYSGMGTSYGW